MRYRLLKLSLSHSRAFHCMRVCIAPYLHASMWRRWCVCVFFSLTLSLSANVSVYVCFHMLTAEYTYFDKSQFNDIITLVFPLWANVYGRVRLRSSVVVIAHALSCTLSGLVSISQLYSQHFGQNRNIDSNNNNTPINCVYAITTDMYGDDDRCEMNWIWCIRMCARQSAPRFKWILVTCNTRNNNKSRKYIYVCADVVECVKQLNENLIGKSNWWENRVQNIPAFDTIHSKYVDFDEIFRRNLR